MENIKTVRFADLCPDRCNFKDKAFEEWVNDFMDRFMPGFSIGLLDTESELAFERWQIEPEDRYEVAELKLVVYTCHDCGEEYPFFLDKKPKEVEVCCPLESLARQGEEGEPELFEEAEKTWLVLEDTHYSDGTWVELAGNHCIDLPEEAGDSSVWGWYTDEGEEAGQKATDMNYESMRENQHGFPWANMWCWIPDDRITDQELKDAGFTVATYCGGQGNWSTDSSFRLCGIDGGGYSFKGQHFAPLAAAVAERMNMQVLTDTGPAYINTKDEE